MMCTNIAPLIDFKNTLFSSRIIILKINFYNIVYPTNIVPEAEKITILMSLLLEYPECTIAFFTTVLFYGTNCLLL